MWCRKSLLAKVKCWHSVIVKLVGYLFWINTSWFLCGETARMHLKVYENSHLPSPIEIMVFLVLGWLFVLIGDYKEMHLKAG